MLLLRMLGRVWWIWRGCLGGLGLLRVYFLCNVGIPAHLGGSGNPSVPTARGIVVGLEAALECIGLGVRGIKVVIQGLGHVGVPVLGYLLEKGVGHVLGVDIDEHVKESLDVEFAGAIQAGRLEIRIVDRQDTSFFASDVFPLSHER